MQVKNIAECSKGEHSAILLTLIKLPFVIKIFVLSILSGHLRQVLLYTHQRNTTETSSDSPQLRPFSKWGLLLKAKRVVVVSIDC